MAFPEGFLIGASTAAHQVEGNNIYSDYWAQEQMPHSSFAEPSGIATADDTRRTEFIRRALQGVQKCLSDGIPVKGYCHWSLMDNFEWQKGYSMTFGLIAVDRNSMKRIPKESLYALGKYSESVKHKQNK